MFDGCCFFFEYVDLCSINIWLFVYWDISFLFLNYSVSYFFYGYVGIVMFFEVVEIFDGLVGVIGMFCNFLFNNG